MLKLKAKLYIGMSSCRILCDIWPAIFCSCDISVGSSHPSNNATTKYHKPNITDKV